MAVCSVAVPLAYKDCHKRLLAYSQAIAAGYKRVIFTWWKKKKNHAASSSYRRNPLVRVHCRGCSAAELTRGISNTRATARTRLFTGRRPRRSSACRRRHCSKAKFRLQRARRAPTLSLCLRRTCRSLWRLMTSRLWCSRVGAHCAGAMRRCLSKSRLTICTNGRALR